MTDVSGLLGVPPFTLTILNTGVWGG